MKRLLGNGTSCLWTPPISSSGRFCVHSGRSPGSWCGRCQGVECQHPRVDLDYQYHSRQHRHDVRVVESRGQSGVGRAKHSGPGQRPVSTKPHRDGTGQGPENRTVVFALILPEFESDRKAMAVHQVVGCIRKILPEFRGFPGCHPECSGWHPHETRQPPKIADDAEFPGV